MIGSFNRYFSKSTYDYEEPKKTKTEIEEFKDKDDTRNIIVKNNGNEYELRGVKSIYIKPMIFQKISNFEDIATVNEWVDGFSIIFSADKIPRTGVECSQDIKYVFECKDFTYKDEVLEIYD